MIKMGRRDVDVGKEFGVGGGNESSCARKSRFNVKVGQLAREFE